MTDILSAAQRAAFANAAQLANPQQLRWRTDPAAWARERMGAELWSKQVELLRSVGEHPRTAVRSGHGIGKTFSAGLLALWWIDTHPPGEAFVISCYTDDTEVLTRAGWKLFQNVKAGPGGDEFATRNQATKQFEWQHATRYYRAPWDGEVVDIKGRTTDLRVTPNHRMLVKWSDSVKSGETFKRADAITRRGADLPNLSTWVGVSPTTVKFGRYEWDSATFAAFLGAWIAEGSLGPARKYVRKSARRSPAGAGLPAGSIVLTQLPGTKGYEPYRELLTRMLGREPCRSNSAHWVFSCSELWHYLAKLGKAATKYIPEDVKNWDTAELETFLHHYLLGDGWRVKSVSGKSLWRSVTVSRRLADDLQEIAQKIGKSATIRVRPPRDALIGDRTIRADDCLPGYYLSYNLSECRTVYPSRSHYVGDVFCVSVPNESLYVRRNGSPIWCGNTAPTYDQVHALLWEEIRKGHRKAGLQGTITLDDQWKLANGTLVGQGRKPPNHIEEAFQGLHRRYVLALIDEASAIPAWLWVAVETVTTNEDCRILAIGNPDNPQAEFFNVNKPGSGWHVIKISVFDSPNLTGEPVSPELSKVLVSKEWVEDKRKRWGENSALFTAKIKAEFPIGQDPWVTVPYPTIIECKGLEYPETEPVEGGIDIGAGGDRTVLRERRGMRCGREFAFVDADPMKAVGALVEKIVEWKLTKVKVDVIGVGWGLVGRLKELSTRHNPTGATHCTHTAEVVGINVAGKPTPGNEDRFLNLRAELWWMARENCRLKLWDLSAVDDDTIAELSAPRYEILDSRGKIKIEAKDDVIKRMGMSPDRADSLLLAYWTPVTVVELPPAGVMRRDLTRDLTPGSYGAY